MTHQHFPLETSPPSPSEKLRNPEFWDLHTVVEMAKIGHDPALRELKRRAQTDTGGAHLAKREWDNLKRRK